MKTKIKYNEKITYTQAQETRKNKSKLKKKRKKRNEPLKTTNRKEKRKITRNNT